MVSRLDSAARDGILGGAHADRDYLRNHADARDAYARVKWQAAQVWSDDRIAYAKAKTRVILDLLDAAETWASAR